MREKANAINTADMGVFTDIDDIAHRIPLAPCQQPRARAMTVIPEHGSSSPHVWTEISHHRSGVPAAPFVRDGGFFMRSLYLGCFLPR